MFSGYSASSVYRMPTVLSSFVFTAVLRPGSLFRFRWRHRQRIGLPDARRCSPPDRPRLRTRPPSAPRSSVAKQSLRAPGSAPGFRRATRRGGSAPSSAAPVSAGTAALRRCPWRLRAWSGCASSRCRAPCRPATRAASGRTPPASAGPRHRSRNELLSSVIWVSERPKALSVGVDVVMLAHRGCLRLPPASGTRPRGQG